jgi:hypothetical protein
MLRRWSTALVALAAITAAAPRAEAAPIGSGDWTVLEATPWVPADGEWVVRWRIGEAVPPDAQVSLTIRQPLRGPNLRTAISRVMGGSSTGAALQDPINVPLSTIRTGDEALLRVPIRARSGSSDRILIPNPGIHPVDVTLSSAGTELDRDVLFLNRLPVDQERAPLLVAAVLSVTAGPTVAPDGSTSVRAPDLQRAGTAAQLLSDRSAPVSVQVSPHLLDALRLVDPEINSNLVGGLRDRTILRNTWVPMDLEAWATGGRPVDIQDSVKAGDNTLTDATGAPTEGRIWTADETIGPASLPALAGIGVRHLILDPGRVAPSRELGTDLGSTQRFVVEGSGGAIDALVLDAALAVRLRSDDPGWAAHRAATELLGMWLAAPADSRPAAVVDLSGVPLETALRFLETIVIPSQGIISAVDLPRAFAESSTYLAGRRGDSPLTRRILDRGDVPDVASLSSYLGRLRVRSAAVRSTMADRTGLVPVNELLLGSQHRDLAEPDQRALLDAAARRIDDDLRSLIPPERRSVTITSRTSTLPFRIENRSGRPATVTIRMRGTRLQFADGSARVVELEPGVNNLKLPVLVRTSGQFTALVETRTANDAVSIATTALRVRSTVVSGVGVVLAGGALSFLVIWWTLTARRSRRTRSDRT